MKVSNRFHPNSGMAISNSAILTVRIAGVPGKIRTKDLPTTQAKSSRYINLLGRVDNSYTDGINEEQRDDKENDHE
jgi:hypothetical protein